MDFVISENIYRNKLFKKCINKIVDKYKIKKLNDYQIYYIDDRMDNIENIKKYYKDICCFHCKNVQKLYLIKNIINMGMKKIPCI